MERDNLPFRGWPASAFELIGGHFRPFVQFLPYFAVLVCCTLFSLVLWSFSGHFWSALGLRRGHLREVAPEQQDRARRESCGFKDGLLYDTSDHIGGKSVCHKPSSSAAILTPP